MIKMKEEDVDEDELGKRFWPFVDKKEDSCWEWTGGKDSDGYGRINYKNKRQPAHKLSYVVHKGAIPSNMLVLRTCNNRLCVNPDHLFLGTQIDSADRTRPANASFITVDEKGRTVFRFIERDDEPVNNLISEIRAMEVLRGHYNTSKADAVRSAISFYHAALKRGLTSEHKP